MKLMEKTETMEAMIILAGIVVLKVIFLFFLECYYVLACLLHFLLVSAQIFSFWWLDSVRQGTVDINLNSKYINNAKRWN